jgi:hypothetical protein
MKRSNKTSTAIHTAFDVFDFLVRRGGTGSSSRTVTVVRVRFAILLFLVAALDVGKVTMVTAASLSGFCNKDFFGTHIHVEHAGVPVTWPALGSFSCSHLFIPSPLKARAEVLRAQRAGLVKLVSPFRLIRLHPVRLPG